MQMLSVQGHTVKTQMDRKKSQKNVLCVFSFAYFIAHNNAHKQISKRDSAHLHAQLP